ncbi:hypothetical protein F5Y16DRAFT_374053 [Xylariaceae sp. FL0255]|nr:hypothetical protein F5Y16DRAFT_374053 [Xylariaceae sp. FL0255]
MIITTMTTPQTSTPFRQIRALYDKDTITVYQAYSELIATAAVEQQKLDASPAFLPTRMTWIKPSWAWMMYRSGYSYKDKGQSRILALRIKHKDFQVILRQAIVTNHGALTEDEKTKLVRVQWDPERDYSLEKLAYRSIQIGMRGEASRKFVNMVIGIEDVTEKAKALKRALDEKPRKDSELVDMGLVPQETVYPLPDDITEIFKDGGSVKKGYSKEEEKKKKKKIQSTLSTSNTTGTFI